jgi:hypothetical protein
MAVTGNALTTATYHDTLTDIGTGTDRRDVSEMLDLWAHKETPFLNKLSWGAETGGMSIEWISEHLGFGYLVAASAVACTSLGLSISASGMGSTTLALEQVTSGTMLFHYDSALSTYALLNITEIASTASITIEVIGYSTSAEVEIAVGEKLYILGDVANEGSGPKKDKSRTRATLSNKLMILRKDIQITGSMAATDFHAVEDELRHQIQMRLKEMQHNREMIILLSKAAAQSATQAGVMNGVFGFLIGNAADSEVVNTSAALTETGVNDMVATLYENNSTPDCLVLPTTQARKFTTWDRDKIRTTPDARIGGHFVTKYLTDVGVEIEIIMMRQFPVNMGFVLDSSKIHPRAKKGRKLFIEKLGIDGDRTSYQIISEFSLEVRGYNQGQHGMWTSLTG